MEKHIERLNELNRQLSVLRILFLRNQQTKEEFNHKLLHIIELQGQFLEEMEEQIKYAF